MPLNTESSQSIQTYYLIHIPYLSSVIVSIMTFKAFFFLVQDLFQDHTLHLVIKFHLEQFLNHVLPFLTLTFSKSIDQQVCVIFLNLALSDASSQLDLGCAFLAGILQEGCCVLIG